VERSGTEETLAAPLSPVEVAPLLAGNTIYWDEEARQAHNSAILHALLSQASLYRLKLGTDRDNLVAALNRLANPSEGDK
jgi:hypothetical protein